MTMTKEEIQVIEKVFGLDSSDIARFLGVAPITVRRWKEGVATPVGLADEVLKAFYAIALDIEHRNDKYKAQRCKALMKTGLGAFILTATSSLFKDLP